MLNTFKEKLENKKYYLLFIMLFVKFLPSLTLSLICSIGYSIDNLNLYSLIFKIFIFMFALFIILLIFTVWYCCRPNPKSIQSQNNMATTHVVITTISIVSIGIFFYFDQIKLDYFIPAFIGSLILSVINVFKYKHNTQKVILTIIGGTLMGYGVAMYGYDILINVLNRTTLAFIGAISWIFLLQRLKKVLDDSKKKD